MGREIWKETARLSLRGRDRGRLLSDRTRGKSQAGFHDNWIIGRLAAGQIQGNLMNNGV